VPDESVIDRYSALARIALGGDPITDCETDDFAAGKFGIAGYDDTTGLPSGAITASLGCGNPVAVADLRPGDRVLDLGSGGGIDVLLSARRVSPGGHAFGLDASSAMVTLARRNAAQAGADNVTFLHGAIEDIPLPDATVDVVISNCVISLSTDKGAVLREAHRVLVPDGRLGISDIIVDDDTDPVARLATEQRVGSCVGALSIREYEQLLGAAGFVAPMIVVTVDHGDGVFSAIVRAHKARA
jgi:SAM-dependent methyltransferase